MSQINMRRVVFEAVINAGGAVRVYVDDDVPGIVHPPGRIGMLLFSRQVWPYNLVINDDGVSTGPLVGEPTIVVPWEAMGKIIDDEEQWGLLMPSRQTAAEPEPTPRPVLRLIQGGE